VSQSARGPLAVLLVLVLTGIGVAALSATGEKGLLDPGAYDPSGAHAVAQLLEDRGVAVRRVDTVESLSTRADSTVFVPIPELLTPPQLERVAALPGAVVVVGGAGAVQAMGAALTVGPDVPVEGRRAACDLDVAVRAGEVDLGGTTYRPTGAADVVGCYASSGRATLVRLPQQRMTFVGAGNLFTNRDLDRRGNAALALGLLGQEREVQWLLPRPGLTTDDGPGSLNDLVPRGLKLAALQLLLAVGVLALWRARRLGPVVPEPLPVVVRAAEAVEGRSRLYRAARARGTAAEALRAGARDRLVRRLGLSLDTGRSGVVDAVAQRTGRSAAEVDALLYGAEPGDDPALIRLADDLDALTREVAGS
jgi:hypothetical protein